MKKTVVMCVVGLLGLSLASARGALMEWSEGWESGYNEGSWSYNSSPAYWNLKTASDAPEGGSYLGLSTYNGKTMNRSFGSAVSPFIVTFYMKTVGGSDYWNYNTIYILSAAGGGQLGLVIRGDSVACGSASYTTASGTWYQHQLFIRPDSVNGGTFGWYVNGQPVEGNQAFGGDALLPCSTIQISRGGNDAGLEGFIDGITVTVPEPLSLVILCLGGIFISKRK